MPDTFKFPRMLCAVVPHVRARNTVVNEFVTLAFRHSVGSFFHSTTRRLPGFAAVIGTLNDLAEPCARLRSEDAVRINRRTLHVINFPTGKVRTVNFPVLALAV